MLPRRSSLRLVSGIFRAAVLALVLGTGRPGAGVCGEVDRARPDSASSWRPEEGVETQVRQELAQRWNVVPEALVLEWGSPRGGSIPSDLRQVELMGHGKDGRWVVSFRSENGEATSVLLRAGITLSLPVARGALERGAILADGDIEFEPRTHWGPVTSADSCQAGWVVHRRIEAGEVLSEPAVRPPLLVASGRPVRAVWSNGRVSLTVQATALGSGSRGERVFVRTEGGTRLDGVVQGPGLVLISSSWMEQGK